MRLRRSGDEGAAVVEFAMVLPLLMMLLLGTITGGLALNTAIAMADAVREGARFGATTASTGTWGADVVTRTTALSATVLTGAQVCSRLEKDGASVRASACAFPAVAPATPAGFTGCVAKVWARKTVEINGVVFNYSVVVDRGSVARYERPC
jgi:Flp pilus assembly protein TadG